jgi:hypothetical protein
MPLKSLVFGQLRKILLHADTTPDRLHLQLRPSTPTKAPSSFEITFHPRPPVQFLVLVDGSPPRPWGATPPHAWPMTRGPLRWAASRDPFQLATRWAHRRMYPRRRKPAKGPAVREQASETMRDLFAALAEIQREAADLCDASARTMALRFPFHMRLWTYARLVEDPSGRLAQLASVCPGVLTFAFGLESAQDQAVAYAAAAHRLLSDVIQGRRLDAALDDALRAWASGAEERAAADKGWDPVWCRVARTSGADRDALLARQRRLIRQAGPMVPSTSLFLPPPLMFAPEDIPAPVRANARWFKVMKCSRLLLTTPDPLERDRVVGFCAFLSRRAPELPALGPESTPRGTVQALFDYVYANRRWPDRRTNVPRLVADAQLWHERRARPALLAELAQFVPQSGSAPNGPPPALPPPPSPPLRLDGAEIAPITTGQALIAEGWAMRHCVATRVAAVLLGLSYVYRATIQRQPLTVEVRRLADGSAWRICEARGFANRRPSFGEWEVLRRWEAQLPCPELAPPPAGDRATVRPREAIPQGAEEVARPSAARR